MQNPHFYGNLPNSPDAYEGTFEGRCIDNCLPEKIFVPTNSSRRVYFNFPRYRRVFDVWKARSTLIFKGLGFGLLIFPWLISFQTITETSQANPPSKVLSGPPRALSGTQRIRRVLQRKLGTLMIGGVSFMPQMILHILVYALVRRLLAHSSLAGPVSF